MDLAPAKPTRREGIATALFLTTAVGYRVRATSLPPHGQNCFTVFTQ